MVNVDHIQIPAFQESTEATIGTYPRQQRTIELAV